MRATQLFQDLFSSEKVGGLLLVLCAAVSLLLTNSAWGAHYVDIGTRTSAGGPWSSGSTMA
ncbi:MAG: hypothetical protein IPH53_18070 [Flavobacteriales bacterium]|nr:hypothetical protein [Flavobacteriales bacterium]